jgi:hypothetical protein
MWFHTIPAVSKDQIEEFTDFWFIGQGFWAKITKRIHSGAGHRASAWKTAAQNQHAFHYLDGFAMVREPGQHCFAGASQSALHLSKRSRLCALAANIT